MHNYYKILGVTQESTVEEIKTAFKNRARQIHPDKGGTRQEMQMLNEAYKILTDPDEFEKWQATQSADDMADISGLLTSASEKPSDPFRRWLRAMQVVFSKEPLNDIATNKRSEAFSELNKPLKISLLTGDVYKNMYSVKEKEVVCEDIYQYISYQSKNLEVASVRVPLSFFQKPINLKKSILLFIDFLSGKYSGENLELLQNYFVSQISQLQSYTYEATFYSALLDIISSKNFATDHQKIIMALEQINSFIYQSHLNENSEIIALIHNAYFRYFVANALQWDLRNVVQPSPKNMLQEMRSKFIELRQMFRISQVHLALEHRLQNLFSENIRIEEVYACGYILIDLSIACVTSASRINSKLMAALCFHYAAMLEAEPTKAMAAECIALHLYQNILALSVKSNVIIAFYTAVQVVKCLTHLKYDQSTITAKEVKEHLLQPGDWELLNYSGSVTSSIAGTIKRAFYWVDIVPFYSKAKSTLDIEVITLFQLGMLRALLHRIIENKESIERNSYAKAVYHAYELALVGWGQEELENAKDEERIDLRMQSIETLLAVENRELFEISNLLDTPFTPMKRDTDGWLVQDGKLDFPKKAGVATYSAFNGYKINKKTGKLEFSLKECAPGEIPLITEFDLLQMMKYMVGEGVISLDHHDANKPLEPLQKIRIYPPNIIGTEFARALLLVDYLLKMFTVGVEVMARPPYLIRPIDKLIAKLPAHLKEIVKLCSQSSSNRPHRFWITVGHLERKEINDGDDKIVVFGDLPLLVQKHLLDLMKMANSKMPPLIVVIPR